MPSSTQSITQRKISNSRLILATSKARGSERELTEEELNKEQAKLNKLLDLREEEKEANRRKIIQPIDTHTTSEVNRSMTCTTAEASSSRDHMIEALSAATGKDVECAMLFKEKDRLMPGPDFEQQHKAWKRSIVHSCSNAGWGRSTHR